MNLSDAASWTQVVWGASAFIVFLVTMVWGGAKVYFKFMGELKEIKNLLIDSLLSEFQTSKALPSSSGV